MYLQDDKSTTREGYRKRPRCCPSLPKVQGAWGDGTHWEQIGRMSRVYTSGDWFLGGQGLVCVGQHQEGRSGCAWSWLGGGCWLCALAEAAAF